MAGHLDEQIREFLDKTREDLRRAAENVKSEAQRLLAEVNEPPVRKRLESQLRDIQKGARKTADDVRGLLEKRLGKAPKSKKKGKKPAASRKRPVKKAKAPAKGV